MLLFKQWAMYSCLDAYESFITKTQDPVPSSYKYGLLGGNGCVQQKAVDLWSILDSLKAIHLSIILPCECDIVFSPSTVDVMCKYIKAFIYIASSCQYLNTYSIQYLLQHYTYLVITKRTLLFNKYYLFLNGQLTCNSEEGQW